MSKAFTKEDDESGFIPPAPVNKPAIPRGSFQLTSRGERLLRERGHPQLESLLARAEKVVVGSVDSATLGVTVRIRAINGPAHGRSASSGPTIRSCRLVSAEERALLDDGCSIESPLGRALLGARLGEVREVALPRGTEELEVVSLEIED